LARRAGALLRESPTRGGGFRELRRALAALNREGRERMVEAFGRVNAEFGRLFRLLFGGGEARLAWVDAEDPLEAGWRSWRSRRARRWGRCRSCPGASRR
jgi:chromosome segregation protein